MGSMKKRRAQGHAIGAMVLLLMAGCRSANVTGKVDVNRAAEEARQATQRAGNEVASRAEPAMRRAGQQARQETRQAGKAMADSEVTIRVKAALMASDRLNTSAIDVDTRSHIVYLKGSVPQTAQKSLAETIAKSIVAPNITVVNQLQVRPGQPPSSP